MNDYDLKSCECGLNCPYHRMEIVYICGEGKKKRRKKDAEQRKTSVSKIFHYCLYKKEKTEITSANRYRISCYCDEINPAL